MMGILKKPKFLIIGGAALFVVIALAVFLVFLLQPKTVGFFGLSKESEEAVRLQECLESKGYTVYYAENLEDLKSLDCNAWIVQTTSDLFAEKILQILGDKAIFIGNRPSLPQPIRYVGMDMKEAGTLFAKLLADLPNAGDTNEDGTLSCLLLTAPEGHKEKQDFLQGLEEGMETFHLPHTILDVLACPRTEEAGYAATLDNLSTYGRDIEVILVSSEAQAAGAAQAIHQSGWEVSKDFYLLSTGCSMDSMNALNEWQRSGLVFASQEDLDDLVLTAVADTIRGKNQKEYLPSFKLYQNTTFLQ